MAETMILLHGFSRTGRMWDGVVAHLPDERYRPLAPDLPGHGSASSSHPVSFETCVAEVLAAAPGQFMLAGYSMGGRVALHIALARPDRVKRLVLISTTAGIEDDAERARRRREDHALADEIERDGVALFARRWGAQPLLAGRSPEESAQAQADRLRNRGVGLAASLRGTGTGAMEPLWDRLGELTMPVTVVVGESDSKFRSLGGRLAQAIPDARLRVIPDSGHAVHMSAPQAVARLLVEP